MSRVMTPENRWITLPETNIAPKNGWLEYYFPIGEAYLGAMLVSGWISFWLRARFKAC